MKRLLHSLFTARFAFTFVLLLVGHFHIANQANAELKPVGAIRYPLPTRPAIVVRGECFKARVSGSGDDSGWSAEISLKDAGAEYYKQGLNVKSVEFKNENETWDVELCVPEDAPEELYDLVIANPGMRARSRRSVKVIPHYRNEYSFIHITDVHIGCCKKYDEYARERTPEVSPEKIFSRIAEEVNLLNPEFVIITGDIVTSAEGIARTRGGIESTFAQDEFRDFMKILDRFEAPTFVIPGNHDLVGTIDKPLLKFWEKMFAYRYFSFTYGDAYFLGIDNSNAMEATTWLYRNSSIKLDKEQREWLLGDLERNAAKPLKVFFFHVNTNRNEIEKMADRYGAQLALFGHWHEDEVKIAGNTPTVWIQTKSALDKGGYRLIRVKDNQITGYAASESGASLTYNNIDLTFNPANNGTHYSVTAAIRNRTTETFSEARLKFIMPAADDYSIFGGDVEQVIPYGNRNIVYVRTDIGPAGSTRVVVAKK